MTWKLKSDVEEAVDEIVDGLQSMYSNPQDVMKSLIRIAKALCPTGEGPVGWAFREAALKLGAEHGYCHQCAEKLVEFEGEWFCPTCDALLLAMRQERALRRVREAV